MDSETDVIILGGSISALMAASYFKHRLPDLDVVVLGPRPDEEKRPIVGESLVEPAIIFFRRIGLGDYLDREQALKNGLSFYYKLAPNGRPNRRYTVHAPEQLHHLSRQLHRPRFDIDLRSHAQQLGARFLEGKATDIELGREGAAHQVSVNVNGKPGSVRARWVVDATGRQRWLGRRVTTYTRPKDRQRSAFWFRLADFEPFTDHIEVSMRRPHKYDLWSTTHHFLGRANWVWCIPLQSEDHERLISIGITYRPDIFHHPMRSMDDFLAFVETEHPAVADMVRSGKVLDTQTYGNYLYWADRLYSADGWFLIGDAARTVDPLYSTGLSFTVVQIEQIAEIIRRQRGDGISAREIDALQKLWMSMANQRQEEISDQYACMHDPFQACMRRYWNGIGWFNTLLPLYWNGCLYDARLAPLLLWLFERGRPFQGSACDLIARVSRSLGEELTQADFDRAVDFDWLLNPRFDCAPKDVPRHFARALYKRAVFRWKLLSMTQFRHVLPQCPSLAWEFALSQVMGPWLSWRAPSSFAGEPVQAPSMSRPQRHPAGTSK